MSDPDVAIVGSGIAGATIASLLAERGYQVHVFEKGPDYPYPHRRQFDEEVLYQFENPNYRLPSDLQNLSMGGNYSHDMNQERFMAVGGSAARWGAMTDRFSASDFKTRTRFGFGEDWPIEYRDLEPYYCRAESQLGVAGSDTDNPFAPWRSRPYPLPPFEFGADTRLLAGRMKAAGFLLHTSPQARARLAYDGRSACVNFNACRTCPIGARYSPRHHLERAIATGRCRLFTDTSVRRIALDAAGRARAVVCRGNGDNADREHAARFVVLAAGAIEVVRLLLLSSDNRQRDGLGNASGHLGKHFLLHHIGISHLDFKEDLFAGRSGPEMGQSRQFLEPAGRGRHGGVLFQLPSLATVWIHSGQVPTRWESADQVLEAMKPLRHCEVAWLHAETAPSPKKYVALSERRDRFGDPHAHVHYEMSEFDEETYQYSRSIAERVGFATRAESVGVFSAAAFHSGSHHMGGCRMAAGAADGVVDSFGGVFAVPNLFVAGSSIFPGSTALHPTLTIVALAIRTADRLLGQLQ